MKRFLLLILIILSSNILFAKDFTFITFIYDDSNNQNPYKQLYIVGNWDKSTGEYAEDWQGYKRFKMYDNGQYNDGDANDHVWGFVGIIKITPKQKFEWACDSDDNGDNGWIGAGAPFYVNSENMQTIDFKKGSKSIAMAPPVEQKPDTADITFKYDDSNNPSPYSLIYICGSWNKKTGEYDGTWQDFDRFEMYDDGKHNDGTANDRVWGYTSKIIVNPGQKFEWACDSDVDKENHWLGKGIPFTVQNTEPQTINFKKKMPSPVLSGTELITKAAAPYKVEDGILFSFKSPDAFKVYLAGDFNNWANNDQGKVTDSQFEMVLSGNGIWTKVVKLRPKLYKYKYVTANRNGECSWSSDPFASENDSNGNSFFDASSVLGMDSIKRVLIPGRELTALNIEPLKKDLTDIHIRKIKLDKIWVEPGETVKISFYTGNFNRKRSGLSMEISLKSFYGRTLFRKKLKTIKKAFAIRIKTTKLIEGGYIVSASIKEGTKVIDKEFEVLSVVKNISDDLRYGFYSNWTKMGKNYENKADYFAQLHINAVEFYDYFPGHGYYAPREKVYENDPFGIKILGEDVQKKIDSAKKRNILSIAYVAAYSSSKSIYKDYPYPMTTKEGIPRVFFHYVMPENKTDTVWFYLMAIAKDTKWYPYIMDEFKRCLDDSPEDLVSFDGFEIDSYGHDKNDRYYSKGSSHNGELLSKVIRDLVRDVRDMTHMMKSKSAVSFNCVNEYGIENMYDVSDFLFIENWSGFKSFFEDLTDICYNHRKPKRQRVILKIYPADTKLGQKYWTAENLKLVLGAAMTGAGSVMVAGEPDEVKNEMHALNSLYYPDNVAIPQENFNILKNYYLNDALLYRITHGKNVYNLNSRFELPGCIIRTYRTTKKYIVIQILHNERNWEWSKKAAVPETLTNYEIAYKMPSGKTPAEVYYSSPDFPELIIPAKIDWEFKDGHVRTLIPRLQIYGTLLIKYK